MQKFCKQTKSVSEINTGNESVDNNNEHAISTDATMLEPPKNKKYLPKTDADGEEHYNPSVRLIKVEKVEKPQSDASGFGFHLTRSKWDPYPWVSAVDAATPAELCGLKAGDCILEVNGEDVLGLRIQNIAKLVKANSEHVTLLLWRTGMDTNCDPESLCCGPMPFSLQRLSVIMQKILSIIECPVCLDTIPPPAMQCQNGHLLCVNCRIRAEKCPVCRDRYTPRRALIAEQIYNAITNAFNLCQNEDKLRQKLFGPNARHPKETSTTASPKNPSNEMKANQHDACDSMASPSMMPRNKFLAKLLGKACSMDNLVSSSSSNGHGLVAGTSTPALMVTTADAQATTVATKASAKLHSTTNQLCATSSNGNHKVAAPKEVTALRSTGSRNALLSQMTSTSINTPGEVFLPSMSSTSSATSKVSRNNIFQANSTFKHFSLSTNDLSVDGAPIAIERCPSMQRLNISEFNRNSAAAPIDVALDDDVDVGDDDDDDDGDNDFEGAVVANRNLEKPLSPLLMWSRRPCSSLNSSVECIQRSLRAVETTTNALKMTSTSAPFTTKSCSTPTQSTSLQLVPSSSDIKNDLLTSSTITASAATSSTSSPSTKPSLTASPALVMTEAPSIAVDVATDVPVTTSPHLTVGDNLQYCQLLKPVECKVAQNSKDKSMKNRLLCPFNCGKSFPASCKLQRHIRVVHHTPILSFGGSSAKLALPLQSPLNDAVLLLEVENNKILNGNSEEIHDDDDDDYDADAQDNHVKNDDKRCTKECWIRLKTSRGKDGCRIYASALMQGSIDECRDFLLETEVTRQQLESGEEQNKTLQSKNEKNNSKNCGIDDDKELKPQQQQHEHSQQQQPLLTRSIVQSMESTTWHELLDAINSIDNNNNNDSINNDKALENYENNDKEINNSRNKNNEPEHWLHGNGSLSSSTSTSTSTMRITNDVTQQSVVSVIFQNDQHAMLHGVGSEVSEMVLNINVRHLSSQ